MVLAPTDTPYIANPMNNNGNANTPLYMPPSYATHRSLNGGLAGGPQSWNDLPVMQPFDPRSILLAVSFGGVPAVFGRSTSFIQASWGTNPFAFTTNAKVFSLDTTDQATVVDGQQWTQAHQMVTTSASITGALKNLAFLRAGRIWNNQLKIDFGVLNYTNVQISFRDNMATSGTFLNASTGTVPVFQMPGTLTGLQLLNVTILKPGRYMMAIVASNAGTFSVFEMEWMVIS